MEDFNNPHFICATAKDFLEKSSFGAKKIYTSQIKTDAQSLGQLAFPMATIAFSMELGIKGLLKHNAIKIPKKHDLKTLFYLLPKGVQEKIIEHYKSHDEFKGYPNMYLKLGDKNNPEKPCPIPSKDAPTIEEHVEELLKRHTSSFIDFRYLHEFGVKNTELAMSYNLVANLSFSVISILAIEVGYPIRKGN